MLVKEQRLSLARACLHKAVSLQPRYVPALLELGTLLSTQKQYAAAERYLQAAIEEGGPTSSALNNLAIAQQELGKHQEAVSIYKRIIKLDQDDPTAHYNLGTAQERAGNYKEAVKAYKVAIDLEPEEAKY